MGRNDKYRGRVLGRQDTTLPLRKDESTNIIIYSIILCMLLNFCFKLFTYCKQRRAESIHWIHIVAILAL